MHKVLMLEFNEICPPLLERWMGEGKLPNFTAFYRASQAFTSVADEVDPANLEPWIQWYSIHTGLPYSQHKIFHLTDGPKGGHADLWQELAKLDKSVMNCSSMNARAISGSRTFYLPDPWCAAEPAYPAALEKFKAVVCRSVQEYSRGITAVPPLELAAFLLFLAGHGLSAPTVAAILRQFFLERIAQKDLAWQRVALLDRLQFDVFRHYYRRLQPDFATFFINSTAHLQHSYWRHMDPGPFMIKPSPEELNIYGDAVLFGYQAMDRLLYHFCSLTDPRTVIILCSALSQQPFLKRESRGGQHFYRLRDPAGFLGLIDLAPAQIEPIMTHQYMLRFRDRGEAVQAMAALQSIRAGNDQVFGVDLSADDSLHIGCQIFDKLENNPEVIGGGLSDQRLRFLDILYPIDAVKSARHHPEGVLWIRTGGHWVHPGHVSILDIAPTVYDLIGVRADSALSGKSLAPRFQSCSDLESQAA
jgi:hypothetical protein